MDPIRERDLYAVLGVAEDATTAEILQAYRSRHRLFHPDLYPDDPEVRRWAAALDTVRDILTDPVRRAEYDQRRSRGQVGLEPLRVPVPQDASAPTLSGKIFLTPQQAREGCVFEWTHDSPEGPAVRTLQVPAGVAPNRSLEYMADVIDGVAFPQLRLHIVIEAPEADPAAAPDMLTFRETTAKRKRPLIPVAIASAAGLALAVGLVLPLLPASGGAQPEVAL